MTVDMDVEPWLSDSPPKHKLYLDDIYFREAAGDCQLVLNSGATRGLEQVTFLLLKPEAVVARRGSAILEFLAPHGFEVLGACPAAADRHVARSLWRYQLNAAPLALIRALDILIQGGDFLCIGVRHPEGSRDAPAASGLAARKGSWTGGMPGGSLRQVLGTPTMLLDFVHAPDDPADVLRELGIFFDTPARRSFIALLLGQRKPSVTEDARNVLSLAYARHPSHHLDVARSLSRVEESANTKLDEALTAQLAPGLARPLPAGSLLELVEWLAARPPEAPLWDRIVVAAHLVGHLRLERAPLIGPPAWERGRRGQ